MKNKTIKHLFQTFRYRNNIILMTVPTFNSVDVGIRRLTHAFINMQGQILDGRAARGTFEWVQTNSKSGKQYFKMPRFYKEREHYSLTNYIIPRPPKEIEDAYKEKKEKINETWKNNWGAFINAQVEFMKREMGEKIADSTAGSISEVVDKVTADPDAFIENAHGKIGFAPAILMDKFGIGLNRARSISSLLNSRLRRGEIKLQALKL
jgi:hypothetical protein